MKDFRLSTQKKIIVKIKQTKFTSYNVEQNQTIKY